MSRNNPIVLIADRKYLNFVPANLFQITLYAPINQVVYLVLDFPLSKPDMNNLKDKFPDLVLIFKSVKLSDYISEFSAPKRTHVSNAALIKFFLPRILIDEDCVLYLDIDTVICKSIIELLHFQPKLSIAATEELGVNSFHREGTRTYFNSGVMVMSLKKLRAFDFETAMKKMATNEEFTKNYVDQEIFNVLLVDSVEFLPQMYNVFICNIKFNNLGSFIKSPAVVHFVGLDKPWTFPRKTKYSKMWLESFTNGLGRNPNAEQIRILKSRRGNFNLTQIFSTLFFASSRYFRAMKLIVPSTVKVLLKEFF